MVILVINAGSSSLKFSLFKDETAFIKGIVEKIGQDSKLIFTTDRKEERSVDAKDHKAALQIVLDLILEKKAIKDLKEISAIGHRVVHGAELFTKPTIITEEVKKKIKDCFELAPLHNPHNYEAIIACEKLLPGRPNVAVFDTAFHQTMPKHAYIYALPYEYYRRYGIRRYGFHGTSHEFVAHRAAHLLGKDIKDLRLITCHLGNGASMCAINAGVSIDTSMGFTPLEGLVMGTRSGDLDPAIVTFLMEKEGLKPKQMDDLLNKRSGMLGISGMDNDLRPLRHSDDPLAQLAIDIYCYRIRKYIGAYMAAMCGLDAIIFTAGVGEHAAVVRKKSTENMEELGIKVDHGQNKDDSLEISTPDSRVRVFVIPTDEELMIAWHTKELVGVGS